MVVMNFLVASVFNLVVKLRIMKFWLFRFELEGRGQSSPNIIGILTKVFCTSGPNGVILAWMGHKLSRGQTEGSPSEAHTDGRKHNHTDRRRQRQYPKAKTGFEQKAVHGLSRYATFAFRLATILDLAKNECQMSPQKWTLWFSCYSMPNDAIYTRNSIWANKSRQLSFCVMPASTIIPIVYSNIWI